jgi:hypothetical protein
MYFFVVREPAKIDGKYEWNSWAHTDFSNAKWVKREIVFGSCMLWVRLVPRATCSILCDKVCQWRIYKELPIYYKYSTFRFGFIVFTNIFNNISVISCRAVSFIGGGNRRTRCKPQTCRKSLTNFIETWNSIWLMHVVGSTRAQSDVFNIMR